MQSDRSDENTNGESDGEDDGPERPGAASSSSESDRDVAEGRRDIEGLPPGADTAVD